MQNNRILRGESFYQRYGVSPEGLVLWLDQSDYRSYGDAGNWYDLSGKSNHGVQATASKQPTIGGGSRLAGMARTIDGVDDYMTCGVTGFNQNQGSVITWVKSAINTSGIHVIWQWTDASRYYVIGDGIGFGTDSGGSLIFRASNDTGGSAVFAANSAEALLANVWTFIAATWKDGEQKLYKGVAVIASDNKTITGNINIANNISYIGGYSDAFEHFNGAKAMIGGFNRALSAAEIQRLYLADAPRFGVL